MWVGESVSLFQGLTNPTHDEWVNFKRPHPPCWKTQAIKIICGLEDYLHLVTCHNAAGQDRDCSCHDCLRHGGDCSPVPILPAPGPGLLRGSNRDVKYRPSRTLVWPGCYGKRRAGSCGLRPEWVMETGHLQGQWKRGRQPRTLPREVFRGRTVQERRSQVLSLTSAHPNPLTPMLHCSVSFHFYFYLF